MVDASKAKRQKPAIRKRTPLEQAIAEQTNRRARWDAKKAREGYVRTTVIVHRDGLEQVKALVRKVNADASRGRCND